MVKKEVMEGKLVYHYGMPYLDEVNLQKVLWGFGRQKRIRVTVEEIDDNEI